MNLGEALALARRMEEARNRAFTQYKADMLRKFSSLSTTPAMTYRWENDWPHDCRASTRDGVEFLVGFNVNIRCGNGVESRYQEIDCLDDLIKQYGHLYINEGRDI